MEIKDIKRTDILFFMQLSSATFSTVVSLIALRRFFSESGWINKFSIRQDLKKYYYLAIILVILLAIGTFIYFRISNDQFNQDKKETTTVGDTGVVGSF